MITLSCVIKILAVCSFVLSHVWRTDRQTELRSQDHASIAASRGKNQCLINLNKCCFDTLYHIGSTVEHTWSRECQIFIVFVIYYVVLASQVSTQCVLYWLRLNTCSFIWIMGRRKLDFCWRVNIFYKRWCKKNQKQLIQRMFDFDCFCCETAKSTILEQYESLCCVVTTYRLFIVFDLFSYQLVYDFYVHFTFP